MKRRQSKIGHGRTTTNFIMWTTAMNSCEAAGVIGNGGGMLSDGGR